MTEEKERALQFERDDFQHRLKENEAKCNRLVAEKEEEIRDLIESKERMQKSQQATIEELTAHLNKLQNVLDEQNLLHETDNANFNRALNEQRAHRREQENKMHLLEKEIEKLKDEVNQKSSEIERLKEEVVIVEKSKVVQIEELRTHWENRKKTDAMDYEIRFSAERSAYETQIMQLQQKLEEFQESDETLRAEISEMRAQLEEKHREFDTLRARESSMATGRYQEMEELRKSLENFKRLYRVNRDTVRVMLILMILTRNRKKAERRLELIIFNLGLKSISID